MTNASKVLTFYVVRTKDRGYQSKEGLLHAKARRCIKKAKNEGFVLDNGGGELWANWDDADTYSATSFQSRKWRDNEILERGMTRDRLQRIYDMRDDKSRVAPKAG